MIKETLIKFGDTSPLPYDRSAKKRLVQRFLKRALFVGTVIAMLFAGPASVAFAASIDRLNAFMNGTQSARAGFTQKIIDRQGKSIGDSSGTLEFARPGKFRWVYVKPYAQTIVGDGERVWIHDPDLNQVTVRKIGTALGSTPAALLSGNNEAMKAFALTDEGAKDGLEWVLATPKEKDTGFDRIRMGFSAAGLEAMELYDGIGQQTTLRFAGFARNPKLDADAFRFVPPKGVDIVGEK